MNKRKRKKKHWTAIKWWISINSKTPTHRWILTRHVRIKWHENRNETEMKHEKNASITLKFYFWHQKMYEKCKENDSKCFCAFCMWQWTFWHAKNSTSILSSLPKKKQGIQEEANNKKKKAKRKPISSSTTPAVADRHSLFVKSICESLPN